MKKIRMIFVMIFAIFHISCEKFLEIDPPKSSLIQETVFQNDDQATSAVKGMYVLMSSVGYAAGGNSGITCLAGLSSDELVGYSAASIPFYENDLTPDLGNLSALYSSAYQIIYTANAILEGLEATNQVSQNVKVQLKGEALFSRAFSYFYLVNLFGSVPLQLTTDYKITQVASKASMDQIYKQILEDLKSAELLLKEAYPSEGRVRPNKTVVQALLARTYLYLKDWENAELYANIILAKVDTYKLVKLNDVFLANSLETIWQLIPSGNSNTQEGALFILQGTLTQVALRNNFALNAFEAEDQRQISWVKSFSNNTGTYYFPFKYKLRASTTPVAEYSMVFRFAEQYLIRAEARINQEKIPLGIADLNVIRERARPVPTLAAPNPLPPLLLTLNKIDALAAVEQERRVELFTEWGHRWFDLKRTDRSTVVLAPIKTRWQATDVLYPIPQNEVNRNPNVK